MFPYCIEEEEEPAAKRHKEQLKETYRQWDVDLWDYVSAASSIDWGEEDPSVIENFDTSNLMYAEDPEKGGDVSESCLESFTEDGAELKKMSLDLVRRVSPMPPAVVRCFRDLRGEESMRKATGASLPMLSTCVEAVADHYWEKWHQKGLLQGHSDTQRASVAAGACAVVGTTLREQAEKCIAKSAVAATVRGDLAGTHK